VEFVPTRIPEVVLIKPRVLGDVRGFFFETWHERRFAAAGIAGHFVQDNHSHSTRYSLRGLHFQIRQPQGKLVRVSRGEVFDVVVDLPPGDDPGPWEQAGATWVVTDFGTHPTAAEVRSAIEAGPRS